MWWLATPRARTTSNRPPAELRLFAAPAVSTRTLLVLAAMQPFLRREASRAQRLPVLIDISASMAALDSAGAADGKRYLATIAAGCDRSFVVDELEPAWIARLSESLDWINLMTYDYHGTWETRAGMVAPLGNDLLDPAGTNIEATVRSYIEAGVPPRSLTLGLPFYGKGWSGCEAGPRGDGLYQQCTAPVSDPPEATYSYSMLRTQGYLVQGPAGRGFARHWSAAAQGPYLYNPESRTFIAYDDEDSVRGKMRYLVRLGLRGAMYWEIALDNGSELAGVVSAELPH